MKYWSREDTKAYFNLLEDRIEDISHYLDKTLEWCEEYGVDDEKTVFMCMFLTCIWVSQLRDEPITYVELMELLGVEVEEIEEEKFYELDDHYMNLTHKELLLNAIETFRDDE